MLSENYVICALSRTKKKNKLIKGKHAAFMLQMPLRIGWVIWLKFSWLKNWPGKPNSINNFLLCLIFN